MTGHPQASGLCRNGHDTTVVGRTSTRQCRACVRERDRARNRDHMRRRAARMAELLADLKWSSGCRMCGARYRDAMVFHHRDPASKSAAITSIRGWRALAAELEKCDVLCVDCHGRIHRCLPGDALALSAIWVEHPPPFVLAA